MKQAIIVTENRYPCEDAGALRQHATAKILEDLGYSVVVAGYGAFTGKKILTYDNIDYTSFRPNTKNPLMRLIYRLLYGKRVLNFIRKNYPNAAVILVVDMLPYAFKSISKYAKKRDIILIHDSVEWYSPEEFKKGTKDISYQLKEQTNRKMVGKGWRVMAISTYLENHFSKICDKTARVPVIMDVASIECNTSVNRNSSKIQFAYVGSPVRKDYLKEIIEGFGLLSQEQLQKLELHIVGVNERQLRDVCGVSAQSSEALGDALVAHGRVPHDEAIRFVREADYTLLFRDASLRYAKAGFPTKIVESLACGTPPVCNLSSDLGMYLRNEENAIIAGGHSPEAVKNAVERALSISAKKRVEIRHQARKTAEQCFDYKNYVSEIETLIN